MSKSLSLGNKVPDISLQITGDKSVQLSDYFDKPLVLFFYPKASTPGCTQEGRDFTANIHKFRRQSCRILGVSRDSMKAQENFKAKQQFAFDLVSDTDEALCQLFDVIKMKNLYGKQSRGIERSTFLIRNGKLVKQWRGVKVAGHVDEVLQAVKELSS